VPSQVVIPTAGRSLGIVTLREEGEEEIVSCMDEDPAGIITTISLLGVLLGFDPATLTCGEVTSLLLLRLLMSVKVLYVLVH
jgi:hypothetical protein